LSSAFEGPLGTAVMRIAELGGPSAEEFLAGFADVVERFAHRGPHEWDLGAPTWSADPTIPLALLETLRHHDDARSPRDGARRAAEDRRRILAELTEACPDAETRRTLERAAAAVATWVVGRERIEDAVLKVMQEARVCLRELGRRRAEAGQIEQPGQVFQLLAAELDDFVADGSAMGPVLASRDAQFRLLVRLTPPDTIRHGEPVPPLSAWSCETPVHLDPVAVGEVLRGTAASPGTVTGRARVVLDPTCPTVLEPGDILIAPATGPSWTPLLLAVAGVISEVGSVTGHPASADRALGVPCALDVPDACRRIPDGALVALDGAAGTVTVLSMPEARSA
jgi:pyruvate,water dikinase